MNCMNLEEKIKEFNTKFPNTFIEKKFHINNELARINLVNDKIKEAEEKMGKIIPPELKIFFTKYNLATPSEIGIQNLSEIISLTDIFSDKELNFSFIVFNNWEEWTFCIDLKNKDEDGFCNILEFCQGVSNDPQKIYKNIFTFIEQLIKEEMEKDKS